MEQALQSFVSTQHWVVVAGLFLVSLLILAKAADWLIDSAVILSEQSKIPKVVIGATIVSLGTTTPEVAISVLAAARGQSSLALGNAVGSVICNTGLILGLSCLLAPPKINHKILNRQNTIQVIALLFLVLACFPWQSPGNVFTQGGQISQLLALVLLIGLAGFTWQSVRLAKNIDPTLHETQDHEEHTSILVIVGKLIGAIILVVISARILLPTVTETAIRWNVPESVIAATLVAFGTSLPELVVTVIAALKAHGELALGNIIGANILNILFVVGAAGVVAQEGLTAGPHFFIILFPVMLILLVILTVGLQSNQKKLQRSYGIILLSIYVIYTVINYVVKSSS
ncbi:MAG: calcium/sodium antiporter [Acidobacteriia bacterium]|jgi:cation:H+ antiporter|nr:calcium/sodium antiporter [Terriglobia bacterium]